MTRLNLRVVAFGFLPVLVGITANAGMIRHDVDIERYRELGHRPEFRAVGRYSPSVESNDYAAGVLIAKQWVLTAAHFPAENSMWKFGSSVYRTKRIIKHPKLVPGAAETQWNGWDLALVQLDRPVEDVLPAIRYRGRQEVGSVMTKVGYGYIGEGLNGLKSPATQERLGGQNVIDAAGGNFESREFGPDVLVFDFDCPSSEVSNRFGAPEPLELEIGGSKGDSGGGVFLQHSGEWQLAGIVSGALSRQIRYGAVGALARVSSANAWIDSVIGSE